MDGSYRDRLVGGYRLLRIRNVKGWTNAALILATAALSTIALFGANATMKPLFLPIGALLPPVLAMSLITVILGMFYRSLEVRYAARDAQRHLLVTKTIQRFLLVTILCAVIAGILLVPPTRNAIVGDATTTPVTQSLPSLAESFPPVFDNQDALAVVRFAGVVVRLENGQSLDVTIVKDSDPPLVQVVGGREFVELPLDGSGVHRYRVSFSNPNPQPVTFTFALRRVVVPALFGVVPGFAIALGIASVAFLIYLQPRRHKYERASIFSSEYKAVMTPGERLYVDYRPPEKVTTVRAAATVAPIGDHASPSVSPALAVGVTPAPSVSLDASAAQDAVGSVPKPPPGPEPEELFAGGANLYTHGDYGGAIAKFDEILRLNPRAPAALLARGNALLRLGRPSDALAMFEDVLSMNAADASARLGKADALAQERRWRDVLEVVDASLVTHPGDPEMLARRGDALLALVRREEAQIAYGAALAKKPGDPALLAKFERAQVDVAALQSRALIASASGDLEQALSVLEQVLKIEPENWNAMVAKATALRRAGRTDEALQVLDVVLGKKPDHGGALLTRGRVLEDRGDLEDAIDAYDQLLELNPKDTDAWVAQGNVLVKMGRDEDARKSYHQALKNSPEDEDLKARVANLETAHAERDQVIRGLFAIKGIGPVRARALQEAGFRRIEDFRRATEDDLVKVHGITRKVAADILAHFRAASEAASSS